MGATAILSTFGATLFALLNPVGMLPVFMGYTERTKTVDGVNHAYQVLRLWGRAGTR
ncbi:hypothetical protein [uncultured Thiodictyon sp.]|jgi:small neutral amino acid transporter SnatA (MarC family)|uniref:hypothetical protein n=1 Tax=uncultured Thiodictyon sp. TaxID=1846217 RepID=UPI0025F229E9|nr:hypothetical protein [uncultured Thiodictyon sp.]